MIQISIYGNQNLHLQGENTNGWILRQITNGRGHILRCSHYVPTTHIEETSLPCVVYCHGNSGCRADANEAAVILLPSNITVFTLDFSGSGLSDGDYVSLGWHEKDDLKAVVDFLRNNKLVSRIGLWGRSMGAVTSLLYGAEDPSIAGMVLDSAFSNLYNLMMELVDVYKIRLPKFTIKLALQYMRHVIQKRAKFDILDLNAQQFAPKTFIPALFGHAADDVFIQPRHSDLIYNSYAGDKNIIKFEGDHNSPRPQFYYDSVSIFFYNVLHPPPISSSCSNRLEKYYELGGLKVGAGMDESLLYEIIAGLRSTSSDAASSSSAPCLPKGPNTKSVAELLSENGAITQDDLGENFLEEAKFIIDAEGNSSSNPHFPDVRSEQDFQGKGPGQNDECCSYTSSNRESWGRCSSLGEGGVSELSSSAEYTRSSSRRQMALKVLATPLRKIQRKSSGGLKEKKKKKPKNPSKELKNVSKSDKFESLGQRLRHCFLGRSTANHRRQRSS
ncbi:alpha/beta-Hydrolases superfamily protein isoform X2 [Wolffia australiana]